MTTESVVLPVDRLAMDPGNPRSARDEEELAELTRSVARKGVLLPLRVNAADAAGMHRVRCGHRRLEAAKRAGLTEVPVVVVEGDVDDAERLVEQLHENLHRRNLHPLEQAKAFREAMRLSKWTAARLAEELGICPSKVTRALALLALPEEVQELVEFGRLTAASAYELHKAGGDPATMAERARAAVEGGLTREQLARQRLGQEQPHQPRGVKLALPLPGGASVALSLPAAPTTASVIDTLETVLAAARQAARQGLGPATLAQMLRDRARMQSEPQPKKEN